MRSRWHWAIPTVVIAAMVAPIVLSGRTFATDWVNHLWLIWVQGVGIGELDEPSYFLQFDHGSFYPYFAFYGGTFYVVLGVVSQLANPDAAVLLAYAGATAAAYLGWTWIARQIGIRGWQSQLPGCIAVTAPYAVTNLYGRGDIPETVATSMIPLLAASLLSMLRERRVRLSSATAYVASVVVLTGSHTLTLAWGTVFLLLCLTLLIACNLRAALGQVRRGLEIAWLTVLGIGINAWILVPLLLYHGRLIEDTPDPIGFIDFTDPERLFSLFRNTAHLYPPVLRADINAQLPVLALLWALLCGTLAWRYLSTQQRRMGIGLLGLLGVFLLLILDPSLIEELPRTLRFVQFPYRLLTFADFCVVGLLTVVLAGLQRAGPRARIPQAVLAAIALLSCTQAVVQNLEVRSWLPSRAEALASSAVPPSSWYAPPQFADGSAPVVHATLEPPLELPVEEGMRNRYAVSYPPGPRGTVETNVATGTYFVDVKGAQPVGRTTEGKMVIRLPASAEPRPVVFAAAWGGAVTAGRVLTLLSLLIAMIGAVVWFAIERRRRRRGPTSLREAETPRRAGPARC